MTDLYVKPYSENSAHFERKFDIDRIVHAILAIPTCRDAENMRDFMI